MPQDRESGARAAAWGHEAAQKIARKIGTTGMGKASNECHLNGERVVIQVCPPENDERWRHVPDAHANR